MVSSSSTGRFERDFTFAKAFETSSELVPCGWELTEEQGEKVLHCYMKMPADVVTNFWLASDETALVDMRIYFPPLPSETSSVYIYGVPNWGLNGNQTISINRPNMYQATISPYDAPPEFHKPRLVREAHGYDKDNSGSWAEYTDAHLGQARAAAMHPVPLIFCCDRAPEKAGRLPFLPLLTAQLRDNSKLIRTFAP